MKAISNCSFHNLVFMSVYDVEEVDDLWGHSGPIYWVESCGAYYLRSRFWPTSDIDETELVNNKQEKYAY